MGHPFSYCSACRVSLFPIVFRPLSIGFFSFSFRLYGFSLSFIWCASSHGRAFMSAPPPFYEGSSYLLYALFESSTNHWNTVKCVINTKSWHTPDSQYYHIENSRWSFYDPPSVRYYYFAVSERFHIFANEFVRKKIAHASRTFVVGNNKKE